MEYQRILYERIGDDIVKITMNRPEKRNAQDALMFEELMDAFRRADDDEDVKVIIFTGAGSSFSAGHDMSGAGIEGTGAPLCTQGKPASKCVPNASSIYSTIKLSPSAM